MRERALAGEVRDAGHALRGRDDDFEPLLEAAGQVRFVLLGEASHGTHEFYRARAEITRRLILEHGFLGVAAEADWPDAWRVNRFLRRSGKDADARAALSGFQRFPTWMWANEVVLEFVEWLHAHNGRLRPDERAAGFYGLDLYSLHASMAAVLEHLAKVDPEAARRARERYSCFDHFGQDSQAYGWAAGLAGAQGCEEEVVQQLVELQSRRARPPAGSLARDEAFAVEQNARLVQNAERYYRLMYRGGVSTWNLRDRHMFETLEALAGHLAEPARPAKLVVWAHNSHLGDARATEMGRRGELNLGQLVRQRWGREALLVGFTTYEGTVTAAHDWDEPARTRSVRPALPGSYEELFHHVGEPRFLLELRGREPEGLRRPRLQRAIGVVYRPETERVSHYFEAELPAQFDFVLHYDRTRALRPLDARPPAHLEDVPETFPSGV